MTLLYPGHAERVKYAVHFGLFGLASVCCAYNAAAWLVRKDHHLATNALLYLGLTLIEWEHMGHHAEQSR